MRKTVGCPHRIIMWSGTTLTNFSGAIIGTHQKVDRIARKYLREITNDAAGFPRKRDILHFEGKNGPDGIKRKGPGDNEPWHFYDPFDAEDTELISNIRDHYNELVKQLKKGNPERAAFDAAWLSHAIVDGLTPAHHYPYDEELSEIRGEDSKERNTIKSKVIMPGETVQDKVKSNWKMYGFDGLLSRHGFFEIGVGFLLAPISMKTALPTETDIETMVEVGYEETFKRAAREIALLEMYEKFYEKGWTPNLARTTRNHLGPVITKTVTLIWFSAMRDAGLLRGKR